MTYEEFLETKQYTAKTSGFECEDINPLLFDFQAAIDRWAIKTGNAGIFADCGLGKTAMQLDYADKVCAHTGGDVLILAPLAVSQQTTEEGKKFGIKVNICRTQDNVRRGINITNYEMLDHFRPEHFKGVVLDESSILKSFMGKTKRQIISAFQNTPYKLSCTATPAPNDHMELLNHAEFLGVMRSCEALSIWFINDTMSCGKYRLKNHAVKSFWEWVSTWAVCMSKPSDIGFSDAGFELPELRTHEILVEIDELDHNYENGFFRKIEKNATAFHKEKRITCGLRARHCADIAYSTDEQYLIWCDTNYEADALKKCIPDAVEVRGDHSIDEKEKAALRFKDGSTRLLISKPSIFGYGLNFQNCHKSIFCGLDYSYEKYYQAKRRVWRFGQKYPVDIYTVLGTTEKQILDTIHAKEALQEAMNQNMYNSIKDIQGAAIMGTHFKLNRQDREISLPDWISA
jgi:superfamily II DNA or RNA helicase